MGISNAAVGAITALCVTAAGAGVYVVTGGHGAPSIPIESSVTAAAPEMDPREGAVHPFVPVHVEPAAPAPRAARRVAPPSTAVRQPRPAHPIPSAATGPAAHTEQVPRSIWSPDSPSAADAAPLASDPQGDRTASFIELAVPADTVVGLQLETSVSSETAAMEDDIVARVTRDVRIEDRVAIPAGAQAIGHVTSVERGGKLRERARLGIRFTSVILADGTRIPIVTDPIFREGSSPGGESAAKIGGGAIGGAIIGGIIGGSRGAVIGGSVGAGAGTAAVVAGGRNAATFPSGTPISARLVEPTTVTIDY